MSRRHCQDCGCGECPPGFLDNFSGCTGTPSSTIGNGWTVDVIGTWTKRQDVNLECVLHESGLEDAQIINEAETINESQVVTITQVGDNQAPGAILRLILNYLDEDNHLYINIGQTTSTFHTADGGQFGEPAYNVGWNTEVLQACLNASGLLSFGDESSDARVRACAPVVAGGRKAGVGNGGSTAVEYRAFELSDHHDTLADCPFCQCQHCDSTCLPDTLDVDIASEECCMGGESFQVGIHEPENPSEGAVWVPNPITGSNCWAPICAGGSQWEFSLHCDDQTATPGWEGFVLKMDDRGEEGCPTGGTIVDYAPVSGSCDPFFLVFEVDIRDLTAEEFCGADPEASPEESGTLIITFTVPA